MLYTYVITLREEPVAYNSFFEPQKGLLSADNSYFWDLNSYNLDV
jgi:hypothetical protein